MAFGETISGSISEVFRSISTRSIDRLISKDITTLGGLNLEKLRSQLGEVNWFVNQRQGFLGGSGGNRMTSIYLVEQKAVVVNFLALQQAAGQRIDAWALHEGFGALGYDDENYQMSSTIEYLSLIEDSLLLEEETSNAAVVFRNLEQRKTERVYQASEGGGTVVGGGGDYDIANFKTRYMQVFSRWFKLRLPESDGEERGKVFKKFSKLKLEKRIDLSVTNVHFNPVRWNQTLVFEREKIYINWILLENLNYLEDEDFIAFLDFIHQRL